MTENISDDGADGGPSTDGSERTDGGRPDRDGTSRAKRSDGADRPVGSLIDPARLRGTGVEFVDETVEEDIEESEFHDRDIDGRALVGVTNEAGEVLLLEHEEQPPILPMCSLDSRTDWATVGRGTVDNVPGLAVTLPSVERVRTVEYRDGGRTRTNYYVVFEGAVADGGEPPAEPTVESEHWDADWYGEVPSGLVPGTMAEDVRLFLDG